MIFRKSIAMIGAVVAAAGAGFGAFFGGNDRPSLSYTMTPDRGHSPRARGLGAEVDRYFVRGGRGMHYAYANRLNTPPKNQAQRRRLRRKAWAAGNRKAFK